MNNKFKKSMLSKALLSIDKLNLKRIANNDKKLKLIEAVNKKTEESFSKIDEAWDKVDKEIEAEINECKNLIKALGGVEEEPIHTEEEFIHTESSDEEYGDIKEDNTNSFNLY